MEEGKLPPVQLEQLLEQTSRSPQIIVGAAVGEDAAVVVGRDRLVITTDPITFTEENIGIYTVAVNCNDIVAMGGLPQYLTTTILLPPGTTEERLRTVFQEISSASRRAGILWVGGHTEVTSAVTRIVVSATAVGFLNREPTTTAAARPGEILVMTKWAALEATTLLARDRPEESRRILGEERYGQVVRWLEEPGISILEEGRVLADLPLGAAHDPTEGGIATGIHEIAARSGVGARIHRRRIPVREETRLLCGHFGLDPLGALSSGVFLFTAAPAVARRACRILQSAGIPATAIGEITAEAGRVVVAEEGTPLAAFPRDELLKILQSGR
jgi:hydrogenase maturation factor